MNRSAIRAILAFQPIRMEPASLEAGLEPSFLASRKRCQWAARDLTRSTPQQAVLALYASGLTQSFFTVQHLPTRTGVMNMSGLCHDSRQTSPATNPLDHITGLGLRFDADCRPVHGRAPFDRTTFLSSQDRYHLGPCRDFHRAPLVDQLWSGRLGLGRRTSHRCLAGL